MTGFPLCDEPQLLDPDDDGREPLPHLDLVSQQARIKDLARSLVYIVQYLVAIKSHVMHG